MPRFDPLTPLARSERMSRIKNVDTKPEMYVSRIVHSMGYRYGLHVRSIPGNPDLVFRPRRKIIFVHGCFWHQHGCGQYRMPRTKLKFWEDKLKRNKLRDAHIRRELVRLGWRVLNIWECQIKKGIDLKRRIRKFLERSS